MTPIGIDERNLSMSLGFDALYSEVRHKIQDEFQFLKNTWAWLFNTVRSFWIPWDLD